MRRIFPLVMMLALFLPQAAIAEELIQAPAEIELVSTVSDGRYDLHDIVSIARHNGIKVIVMTDRDLLRWEYGAWPLRNVIKKTAENSSIFTYGLKKYLQDINDIQRENPDIILIAGTESAAYYHWKGHPIYNNLCIQDWHKHILTMGLKDASDFRNLPMAGNWRALRLPFRLEGLLYIIGPILIIILGIFGINRKSIDYVDSFGRHYITRCPQCVIIGAVLIIIGIAFLINNYPYRGLKFDQYGKDAGVAPYQNFINYVSDHGGLTFWAHPEAEYVGRVGHVNIETRDHSTYILEAQGYTGFAIFYEGYEKIGRPGGIWDECLTQYCRGQRKKPIWAIGALSFESAPDPAKAMKDLRTVLLVPKLGREAALGALKSGRMYVSKGARSSQFVLSGFAAADPSSSKETISGGEAKISGKPILKIKGDFTSGEKRPCTIKIIRNGSIIDILETDTPFDISYDEKTEPVNACDYYRLEVTSNGLIVVTNPIFVRHEEGSPGR